MKKLFALIISAAMLLSFAACGGNDDEKKNNGSNGGTSSAQSEAEEGLSKTDAYDIYNEAVVNFAELSAYDTSIYIDLTTDTEGTTVPIEMKYQFKDMGDDCQYYSEMSFSGALFNYTYYSEGMMRVASKMGADGELVISEETEMDYETFMFDYGNPATGLLATDVELDVFEEADMTVENGQITVVITRTDIDELPEEMATYAVMFGFDPETATDEDYHDTIISLTYTEDGEFVKAGIVSGVDWTKEDGTEASFSIDLELCVNETGDGVEVTTFEAAA